MRSACHRHVWIARPERRSRIADCVRPSVIEGASSLGARATGDCALRVPRLFFFTLICFCFFSRGRHHRAESAPGVLSIRFLFIIIIFCRGVSEPRGATERSISRFPSPRLCFSLSFFFLRALNKEKFPRSPTRIHRSGGNNCFSFVFLCPFLVRELDVAAPPGFSSNGRLVSCRLRSPLSLLLFIASPFKINRSQCCSSRRSTARVSTFYFAPPTSYYCQRAERERKT